MNARISEMDKIKWENSVWFFDIDDTLSDTSDVSSDATEGIRRVFKNKYGDDTALAVKNQVNAYYNLMLSGYRVKNEKGWESVEGGKEAFQNLLQTVEKFQPSIVKEFGAMKKWSREIFVKMASDRLGISVTPELVHEAVDAYWVELSRITSAYPDAVELIKEIKIHNRPIYLLTSSDARLKMQPDGKFIYDPVYSEALKRERIELLREKGIDFNILSIGDPEDKPHRDFFEKAIKKASEEYGSSIDLSNSIMVGDSFSGDLQTPKEQMGFGLVVLVDRTKPHLEVIDEHQINTDNLMQVTKFII
ncbi:MAG TPA: HAD family hydrolase [Candidatus Moranbacteria bacterium]|nr:HAD family hydrolase [Candidatus Moranbacteria bacterium]